MTKSELIELIASSQTQLSSKDVELAIKTILEQMSQAICSPFQAGQGIARAGKFGATTGFVMLPGKSKAV
jgi:nucleoid DNA-binding protein